MTSPFKLDEVRYFRVGFKRTPTIPKNVRILDRPCAAGREAFESQKMLVFTRQNHFFHKHSKKVLKQWVPETPYPTA